MIWLQELFDVGDNLLQGTIPTALLQSYNLRVINININNFNGDIPDGWENMKNLKIIDLSQNRLIGSIPLSIFKSNTIQHFLLQSNLLTGSIPTNIATLENATKISLSHNNLKGNIPAEIEKLENLTLLHFHSNELTGPVPHVQIVTSDQGNNAFITDCGNLDLTCDECTMCCNSDGFCQESHDLKIYVYIICLLFTPLAVALILKFLHSFPEIDHSRIYNKDSVYCFILTRNWIAGVIYFVTVAIQILLFTMFLQASNFTSKETDWNFTFRCPNNDVECKDEDTSSTLGWTMSVLVLLSFLGNDLVKCLFQLRMASHPTLAYRLLFSGVMLGLLTLLAGFTSIIYNVALAESNTGLIVNVVILLFINDLDEKVFDMFEVIAPEWIQFVVEQVEDYLKVIANNAQSKSSFPAAATPHPNSSGNYSTNASSGLAPATHNPTSSTAKPIANNQSTSAAHPSPSGNYSTSASFGLAPATHNPTSSTAKPIANTQSTSAAHPSPSGNSSTSASFGLAPATHNPTTSSTSKPIANTQFTTGVALKFSGNNASAGWASAHSTIHTGTPKGTVVVGTSQASKFDPSSHGKISAVSNIYSDFSEEEITL